MLTGVAMPNPIKRLIPTRGVRQRYGDKAARTIARWVKSGVLPPPDRTINGRHYWWEETLIQHERLAVAEKSAASSAT
jgi:hypothetical protein